MRKFNAVLALVTMTSLAFIACNRDANNGGKAAQAQTDSTDQKILAIMQPLSTAVVETLWVQSRGATDEASFRVRGAQPPASVLQEKANLESMEGFHPTSSGQALRDDAKTYLVEKTLIFEKMVYSLEHEIAGIEGPAKKLGIKSTHTEKMRAQLDAGKALLPKIKAATTALDALK